ncbi:mannan endo-1,4-beta-mannosidase [Actinopolyspora alba]|uniref:Mannan endo-1,4-beta-mannosidase n=1 Tax=Actinopolyspora alba TaxID=673379 RepID=A0A1I1WRK8_9ACTN|nr:glycoside hydrolase family 5 protein [Actinopolyspora alba]SFD97825.1 mannan endo-1,4-beta-mannosidase [Actinopolyspora alba]
MKRRLRIPAAVLTVLAMSVLLTLSQLSLGMTGKAAAAMGFHVSNGRLLDANGNDFVMRGINHAHTWYPNETDSLADIKATGANTVRVVLSSGDLWNRNDTADVASVVENCEHNKLVCVLEVHDTIGYPEKSGAVPLSRAVDYWNSVKSALIGEEDHVLINLGNEPFGNTGYEAWTEDTSNAIQRMRDLGFQHTLIADAPNWGQDWTYTMRDNATSVFQADPLRNTVFSVHMYGVFDTATKVRNYLNHFVDAGLPIMVGEFGHRHSDGDPAEDAVMATAESLGLGYIGWSWSGNSGGVDYLDMVRDFDPNQLTPWGERIINGPNGIRETSEEASVY